MTEVLTPANLSIAPRDFRIDRNANNPRWWHGGDPIATAFFNALSVVFPQGEAFFIESVRRFADCTRQALREQIDAFVRQEGMHTREHMAFNRLIETAGYDTQSMERDTRRILDAARRANPITQLAVTVALEHFTAMTARALFSEPVPLPGAPDDIVRLWQWHGIEELEHKSVAFDTFLVATRSFHPLKSWLVRCSVMLGASFQFWIAHFRRMAAFFRQDGINTARTWWRVLVFLLVKPGLFRKMSVPYVRYFLPGFHPWRDDDRNLISAIDRELSRKLPI